jgi:glycosyltransferase involved in cell wall biosynthesis
VHVLVVALSDVESDLRITKELDTLQSAGYEIEAVGIAQSGQNAKLSNRNGVLITLAPRPLLHRSSLTAKLFRKTITEAAFLLIFIAGVLGLWRYLGLHELRPALTITFGTALLALILALRPHIPLLAKIFQRLRFIASIKRWYTIRFRTGTEKQVQSGYLDLAAIEQPSMTLGKLVELAAAQPERSWPKFLRGLNHSILRVIEAKQFDVIHCHDFTALPVGLAIKRKRPKVKLIYDSHELFSATVAHRPFDYDYVRRVERKASALLDAVITVNDSISERLKRYYPRLPRPTVICNAARRPKAAIVYDGRLHAAARLPPDTKILLYQGAFAAHRGLDMLVEAGPLLPANWAVVLMGWGKYLEKLQAMIGTNDGTGAKKAVIVPPAPQDELAIWTAGAVGAILYEPTNLNNYLCSPNKIWEYPVAEVPVLCNAAPEVAERVKAYGFGWVLPYEGLSGKTIADKIQSFGDMEIADAPAGCRRFIEEDNWSRYEARFVGLYAQLGVPVNNSARVV